MLAKPVIFRSHGGRPADLARKDAQIDVALSLPRALIVQATATVLMVDPLARSATPWRMRVRSTSLLLAITKLLIPCSELPCETKVDAVVFVDSIQGSGEDCFGTTRVSRDPIALLMADAAVDVIAASGL